MKTITLTQPWATLVAIGAKQIETRSWSTSYRGPLAIHAGAGLGPIGGKRGLRELCHTQPFMRVLAAAGIAVTDLVGGASDGVFPMGAVLAIVELYDILPTAALVRSIGAQERAFGDYNAGCYGWMVRNLTPLPTPVPCKGALGLWDWEANNGAN
jgi:hypothetical protein